MIIGNKEFDIYNHCYIMGILNVTPDSFYDGGVWNNLERAKKHVGKMIAEGAAIIDVGGESTRPGHVKISAEQEITRVLPYIKMIKGNFDVPVSIDSYKSEVIEAALEAGADFVNDIRGLKYDSNTAGVIAEYGVPCCLMHNREKAEYDDFFRDIWEDMHESLLIAEKAGISGDKIFLDPGVGFGKTCEQNLTLIKELGYFCSMGYPVLLGVSRKSAIGNALGLPPGERLEGTIAATVMGVERGARIIRVHDVKENFRAMRMTKAIMDAPGRHYPSPQREETSRSSVWQR